MSMFQQQQALRVDESSLTHLSLLGRGGFGYVSLKMDSHLRFYAKKSSPLNYFHTLNKELRIMLHFLNHPRFVQPSSSHLHFGINPHRCYIYMEYAPKGTLHNMISMFRGRPMTEYVIKRVVRMILEGLEAFHKEGYVHCDIKPANILFFPSKDVGELFDLKLADFGLSKEPFTDYRSLIGGTKQYMPPELNGGNGVITPAVDIWSLGCVILQMFGGYLEKTGITYKWRHPEALPPMAKDFLDRCLVWESTYRETAEELLKHPFVAQGINPQQPPKTMLACAIRNNVKKEYLRRQGRRILDVFNALKI